jgi:hypothetical protein
MGYSKTSNVVKEQLGVTQGTAQFRLQRMLIFDFLQRLGLDTCFRCGNPLSKDDFDLDHKEPWLNVDPALYWDLKNVGFSHHSCNSSAHRVTPEQRAASAANCRARTGIPLSAAHRRNIGEAISLAFKEGRKKKSSPETIRKLQEGHAKWRLTQKTPIPSAGL